MPSPCPTCAHAGPATADRTACLAPRSDALVDYLERIGEQLDTDVVNDDCPGWAARVRRGGQAQGLPWGSGAA